MPETGTPKRPPGRPKGTPKSGGRKPGVPNKKNAITRDFIVKNGAPVATLCKIAKGEKLMAAADSASAATRNGVYPTIDQRLNAARILAQKIVPDMKAVEVSGPQGEPLSVRINLGS